MYLKYVKFLCIYRRKNPDFDLKDLVGPSSALPSALPGTRRPRNPDLSYCPILTFEENIKLSLENEYFQLFLFYNWARCSVSLNQNNL